MGCVNKSSKEFKLLAARNNLSHNALELFIHKYWLETGNEDAFPTDVYIQAQLGNGQYLESGKSVREMWEKHYSSPLSFPSFSQLQEAYGKAVKFFPASAVSYYKNAEGGFTLSVRKPVSQVGQSKESFFMKVDSMESPVGSKVLDLGIKADEPYSIDKAQELFNRFNTDRTSADLADKVFSVAKDLGLSVSFNESLPSGIVGRYTNDNTVTYKKSFFEADSMNSLKAPVLLHEILHAVSMYALSEQTKDWEWSKPLAQFRSEINSIYQDVRFSSALRGERGVNSVQEFVAELANPVFRSKLQSLDKPAPKQSFWSRVLNAFKKLLGIHPTSSWYQRSMNALDNALSAFDVDSYMRYNGIKNTVRKNAENIREVTQLNRSLSVIDSAVGSGNWTAEALTAVNNLVNDIENGKVYYQRFPQGTAGAWHQGGRANEVASLLLRAGEGSGGEHPLSFSERYERDKRQQPIQEQIVEAWAKAAGVWHDNLDSVKGKALLAQGGKAKVFYNSGDSFVTKIISTSYFITPQLASDRITLHNALFPAAPLKVIGFGRNSQGEFQFLVEQPFVQGSPASQREIDSFIEKSGFAKSSKDKGHTFTSNSFYVSDLHDENVIKTPQGVLVVIDADLRLNTPELGMGGKYHVDNSVTPAGVPAKVVDSLKPVAYAAPLKPQYRGKLIYAQSGTGKSTIADNISVFDSDYILGDVLGVSPETAGFFFKSLSAQQKKAFGAQYRKAVKDKVAQGFTVLTANESLLPDADVIVYNSSPEQTDERVNRDDRALNNRYHAISYHEDTLSKIKNLKNNDKNKEYIELDKEHYLADYLLSSVGTVSNISNGKKQNESLLRTRGGGYRADGLDRNQLISDFLNEFGISIHILDSYDGELPLFDALNRVINAKDISDITDSVGYAIAFMMQGDPEMQRLIVSSHLRLKGDLNRKIWIPFKGKRSLKNIHLTEWSPVAKEVVAEVGRQIASELRNNFDTPIEKVKSGNKVWNIIKNFFKKIGMSVAALGKRDSVKKQEKLFVSDIIEALGREDFSRIKGPLIKQDTLEKAQRVDIEKALKEHPFEDNIIRVLGNHGIALAGSASIALEGSLFRPAENPLHDIDFSAGDNSSKKSLDRLLPTLFQKDTIAFASQIVHNKLLKKLLRKSDSDCITYVTLSVPFETRNRSKNGWVAEYYSKDGRYLGRKDGSELYLENGVQGKLLDFFVGPTQESNYGFHKQNINGHTYLISNSNAAMAAKILWARPKDMWDYKHFKRDSFSEVSRNFINSLSEKQLDGELALIRQESADYDLVNAPESEAQDKGKNVPQDFTFADGVSVKAPFRPNAQQVDALNAMDRFMKSNETSMTLNGYAGTGKTSLMQMVAEKCRKSGKNIEFCATTNKAAAVLSDKVSKMGFKATTLNKLFGINVEVDSSSATYNARRMVNVLKNVDIIPNTVVVIDEASMINEENYNVLNRIAEENRLKIIYVGDEAQLAPVNEEQVSKVFRNNKGRVISLTQVERTDDNAVLREATAIRNGEHLSGVSSFNDKGKGVAFISPQNQEAVNEVIGHYVKGLRSNPNFFRILAYTNKAVADYNTQVRSLLGYTSPIPHVGEPMTGYSNWGYDWRTKSYKFVNSESYSVSHVGEPVTVGISIGDGSRISMQAVPITLVDSLGNSNVFNFMNIKSNHQNRQAAMVLANEKKRLWAMARRVSGRAAKAEVYSKINDIDAFLFVNDNIEDANHNLLQAKTVDFGYALTIHKSQGSTFSNVLIDDVDISKAALGANNAANAFDAVDLGEESNNNAADAELKGISEVIDLGGLSGAEGEDSASSTKTANIKQQLEYVGVSRASDTVTIISNNVKKEGSPLHPEKSMDGSIIKKDDSRSTSNITNINNDKEQYKATDEFRRVQEAVRRGGKEESRGRSVFEGDLKSDQRQRLADVLGRQLGSIDSFIHGSSRTVTNLRHGTSFNVHSEVNPTLFHDIFEVVRFYTKNAELVDLHDDYSNCKCFLSEDGTAGFAIEPDGNLVSVFNLGITKGFLGAVKDMIIEQGANHLDAYASSKQNLELMYEKTLGFHTAATMDYNMDYDHDDIAKNHGNPQVVFMVSREVAEPKHFDKDSYDDAKRYQMEQVGEPVPSTESPSLREGEQQVSLPGYEYFNDLYEDTVVDAAWKVPFLKELDAQLSTDNSDEENQTIINKMNTLLQSASEDEYRQTAEDSKKSKVNAALEGYNMVIQQLNNLLDTNEISAYDIRHTAELIINSISDEITNIQREEGYAKKIFPSLSTDIDFQTASRREIVEAVGINRFFDRAKTLFDPSVADYDDLDVMVQAALITDNWEAMMTLASDIFAMNEGFGIVMDYSKRRFSTTSDSSADYDNFNDYSNDVDIAAEEGEKDEQEHWQVESRTIDVLNSMSALVRQGLRECWLLNDDGSKVLSKWGIAERVNPREAVNSILRWTQGSLSLPDMVARLSAKQSKNPWLSQLINRLSDKSGKESDFQSQFYGVFSKHFQAYSVVLLENGKYHNINVNSHPALSEAMNTITSLYKIGELPIVQNGRVNTKLLGSKDDIGKNADFSLHRALADLLYVTDVLNYERALDDTLAKIASDNVIAVCRVFGYNVTEDILSDSVNAENIRKWTEYLGYIVNSFDKVVSAQGRGKLKEYEPFGFGKTHSIDGTLRNFLTPVTDRLEDTAVNAFYDSGKMYQSYVTPSFMSKLMKKFHLEGQEFNDFIMAEYGSSEWFKFQNHGNPVERGWRNVWFRMLAKDPASRKVFDHKVELNFNKHNYMRNMTDAEYTLSLITEYFAESGRPDDIAPAWFRVPMQSNKPSSEFIRFYSYRGFNYKEFIVNGLHDMFLQELSRIQTVRMRALSKDNPKFIKNFDSNGRKFCFLPVFNDFLEDAPVNRLRRNSLLNELVVTPQEEDRYNELLARSQNSGAEALASEEKEELSALSNKMQLKNKIGNFSISSADIERLASLIQKKVKGEAVLSSEEEAELGVLADKVIRKSMENRVQSILDKWESDGILKAAKNIKEIYPSELSDEQAGKWVREQVENFLWNDSFASKNILQLTIGDIAFYKDTEDLQKRLAQLHAPGIRGRVDAVDYHGKRVSDGKYRTFILKDFDTFKSNIIANISEVFDRKIAAASPNDKPALIALKESLVGKDGKYTKINVTDAQGYSSPSSYRKKAFIFGRWSRKAEEIYQKLRDGSYTYSDLEVAFQPLKPFVYTKLTKDLGVPNAPIHSVQVPFQAKNAEYLLIMADAILKGEKLSRPNLLRAVYRVMEDSAYDDFTYDENGRISNLDNYNGRGIDTVQFESAIKSGLQGVIDISQFLNMSGGEEAAYTFMMNQIYKDERDAEGKRVYKNYNTDVFVHESSFDDYCLQQEVPEHFKNHSQAHGSQIRMITPSDLDLYTYDENGNQIDNFYEWREPDGTVKRMKAGEFRKEYERTIAENIEESISLLVAELHLNSSDKRERNIALAKILQREILSSPRYGVDLIQACSVDKVSGEFRIPKGDPIQAKRIEQLINSVIKNRVNKQKIAGGPIVQVSNFGTSKQLHIRFNDRQGNLLPLEEEYVPSEHDGLSYKEFIQKNQGGIAYFEVFCPLWSDDIFNKFSNPDGTINVEAINAVDPELLKMVSYRIPTEDKYSCAPMKVVGFMPREAGDAIMLPYELTEIDDSDFDVDKRYVMRKDILIKTKPRKDIEEALFKIASESYQKTHEGKSNNRLVGEQVRMLLDNTQRMKNAGKFMRWLYGHYQRVAYYTEAPVSGRTYRNNKIVDMTYAVLTNPMSADKILNPGGFDGPKRMGYMVAAFKNPANSKSWEELQNLSISELKDLSYTDKDLTFADTQVQFYKQNAAAASLIGVFAVNKVAHATLESNDIFLDVSEICGDYPFTIADTVFGGRMQIDTKYDSQGNLIGKTLGSLVSASADAVKDPILNLMNINMTTAGMLNTMLRLGMPFNDAALFLSQDVVERLLNRFNRENLSNYVSLDSLIMQALNDYAVKYNLSDASAINTQPLTKEELVEGLTSGEHGVIDYKVLLAFQKVRGLLEAMRKPTFATRFNSISSAVGPLIIDNLIIEHKMEAFIDANSENGTHFYTADDVPVDIDDVFFDHPVLKQFSRTVDIAKTLFSDMPTGSTGFRNLLNRLPKDIADRMFSDKKLLSQFSDFYQSYLLIQSGVVNHKELGNYAIGFPKWFLDQNFKEKYPDNALIQAIRMNVSKKSGLPFLQIKVTGLDEQQKESLRSAWIDLHKADPVLSQRLFNYCFFRAGIGFSPKTFMALVPTYVKERIKSADGSASYVDTYRNFPEVVPELVINQFIRNNWNNNKLAPVKGGKDSHYDVDIKHGRLTVYRPEEIRELSDVSYFKTYRNGDYYLWHLLSSSPNELVFERVKPLGNNGEYLEMSTSDIVNPLSNSTKTSNDDSSSDLKSVSPQESAAEETPSSTVPASQEIRKLSELASLIMKQVPALDEAKAKQKIEDIKGRENKYAAFLQNVFKNKGLNLNKEEAIKEFKKYC